MTLDECLNLFESSIVITPTFPRERVFQLFPLSKLVCLSEDEYTPDSKYIYIYNCFVIILDMFIIHLLMKISWSYYVEYQLRN